MHNALPINIKDLLKGKPVEWERLEFKEGWNPLDTLHTVCAFANDFHNLGGGYIFIGIKEQNGRPVLPPVGIDPNLFDAIQKEILNLGFNSIQPYYHPIVVPVEIDGRHILVLWVLGGQTRPYKAKLSLGKECKEYGYFIRKGSSTVRAKGADETELITLAANVPFDDRFNQQAKVDDLSRELMQEYLTQVGSDLVKQAAELTLEELGRQMGVIGGPDEAPFPLNIGLMMFNPEPWRFFPVMQIDVVWFPKEGPGGDKFSEKIFKGPLPRMTRDALDYIKRNFISETVSKHWDRAESTRVQNIPYRAIEEAVVNAVYHRGYDTREPVEIRIMHDELVVLSYPGPDRSVRLEQLRIGKAMPRRYRNRRIGEFLKELEFTEGRSTGIPKIMEAMEKNGSPPAEFEFDEDHSYFMVRLPVHPAALEVATSTILEESGSESRSESRSESENSWRLRPEWRPEWGTESVCYRIMAVICSTPRSRSELAEFLGHKSITGSLRQALADLMSVGLVEYTIPDKPNSRLQKYRMTSAEQ
ncbi:MAG: putative DNA binding domain-containing protein [Deltaproteobacteria bacterium]|nr:putative DNA binding domain-containing protein [Deltaproteobacteria bacterium]